MAADLSFLAFHALSLTPSCQEIERQKSLLLRMPRHDELNRLSAYPVLESEHGSICSFRVADAGWTLVPSKTEERKCDAGIAHRSRQLGGFERDKKDGIERQRNAMI